MKIVDCLPVMTRTYLSRTVDSILKDDIPRGGEERLREQFRHNALELANPARVKDKLRVESLERAHRILVDGVLTSLLLSSELARGEEELYNRVRSFEQAIGAEGTSEDAFPFSDPRAIDVCSEVLEVAQKRCSAICFRNWQLHFYRFSMFMNVGRLLILQDD